MPSTYWTLAATLNSYGKKVPSLAQASGLSKNTIYDIVNGKSQAISLETIDKLIDGLEKIVGTRFSITDILTRDPAYEVYEHLFEQRELFDPMEIRKSIPFWTPGEKAEDAKYWEKLKRGKAEIAPCHNGDESNYSDEDLEYPEDDDSDFILGGGL